MSKQHMIPHKKPRGSVRSASFVACLLSVGCGKSSPASDSSASQKVESQSSQTVDVQPSHRSCTTDASRPFVFVLPYQDEPWITSFDGPTLRSRVGNLKPEKLGMRLRREIADAYDKLDFAQANFDTARDKAEEACEQFLEAHDNFQREVATFKSTSAREATEVADEIRSILECWSYGTDVHSELTAIEKQIEKVTTWAHDLRSIDSPDRIESAAEKLRETFYALLSKRSDIQAAQNAYAEVAKEVASLMYKAATASGQGNAERSALTSAVEALPKIEVVSQQLELIADHVRVTENGLTLARKIAICSSARAVATNGSVTTESRDALAKQNELWEARKASIRDTIASAFAFPGDE